MGRRGEITEMRSGGGEETGDGRQLIKEAGKEEVKIYVKKNNNVKAVAKRSKEGSMIEE